MQDDKTTTSDRDKREYEASVRALGRSAQEDKKMQTESIEQLEENESEDKSEAVTEAGESKPVAKPTTFKEIASKMTQY